MRISFRKYSDIKNVLREQQEESKTTESLKEKLDREVYEAADKLRGGNILTLTFPDPNQEDPIETWYLIIEDVFPDRIETQDGDLIIKDWVVDESSMEVIIEQNYITLVERRDDLK